MGIPYSRQINAAFDQVSPLVASGFEVLQSTKDISLLLAEIQILTALLLCLILLAILALTITVNPDMDIERRALVTPVLKWLTGFAMTRSGQAQFSVVVFFVTLILAVAGYAHWWYYFRREQGIVPVEGGETVYQDDGEEGVGANGTNEKGKK